QAEDGIRDDLVTGVQTCALPICFVRNHSEILFLSHDSNAMNWIAGYLRNPHMHVSSNTARSVADLRRVARAYHPHWDEDTVKHRSEERRVGKEGRYRRTTERRRG